MTDATTVQTDTPIQPQTFPPPPVLERIKGFIGDLARPFAIIASSGAAAVATVVISFRVTGFSEAAIYIGAVYAGVGALYGAKAWEVSHQAKQAAQVEIAKTNSPGVTQ